MNKEMRQEFTRRISNSNRSELIVIMYEILFVYLDDTQKAIEEKDSEHAKQEARNCDKVLNELCSSLNFNYEISGNLFQIYTFMRKCIMKAIYTQTVDDICETRKLLTELYEAMKVVAEQDASAALMKNTQKVYAGMTYHKGSLSEDIQDSDNSRGFRV